MTKSITILALVCLLVAGAAATSILARNSVPDAGLAMTASVAKSPETNRGAKGDRLTVAQLPPLSEAPKPAPVASESVRQAFAYASADVDLPKLPAPTHVAALPADPSPAAEPAPARAVEPVHPAEAAAKPKSVVAALKPEVQKAYALLSDGQIAGIKDRLRLSPDQEYYWPAVETALRAVARKIHAARQGNPKPGSMPIDPDSDEVQQLKSAAMPLLWQLRDDQKDEVRKLARLIGLDRVAAAI